MRRWALAVVVSMAALYLLLGALMPTYVSSGDETASIGNGSASTSESGSDISKDSAAGERPWLHGKPKEKDAPRSGVSKGTTPSSSGSRSSKSEKTKDRPNLLGPSKPVTTKAPVVSGKPANTGTPVKTTSPTGKVVVDTPPADQDKSIKELQDEIAKLQVRIDELVATGGAKNDEEKANAILNLVKVQEEVRTQANKKQAEFEFAKATKFYQSGQFNKSYESAKRAVDLDPANEDYARFLHQVEVQIKGGAAVSGAEELLLIPEIRLQQKMVEINLYIDEAKRLYAEATTLSGRDALEKLQTARSKLGQAQFSLNSIPSRYRGEGMEKVIIDLIKLVEDLTKTKDLEARRLDAESAEKFANQIRSEEDIYLAKVINELINRAYYAIHQEQYSQAELLLQKVVRLDPANREAKYLLTLVQKKGDDALSKDLSDLSKRENRRLWINAEEMLIPYNEVINYPDNWEEINRTRSGFTEVSADEEPEWMQLIRAKMKRKVNVTFVDAPLSDVVSTLHELVGVTIIVDPMSAESVTQTVNITLKQMTFETAIKWVMKIIGLSWTLQDEAIFIATPDRIQGDKIMQMYDIRDLLGAVTWFPGPDISLDASGETDIIEQPEPDLEEQMAELVELIKTKIDPDKWDETTGASIMAREGKLIATNVPAIHIKIEALLDSFRKAQKLQVYINARFITVTDNFLEDIGVNWTGLDRDTTPDLSGIANTQPAGFSSDPSKRTGGWDAYDLRGVVLNNTSQSLLGVTTSPYSVGEGLNLQYALLGDFQAEIILNAIQKTRQGIVLLAPRITVFNTQRAYMMVATQESYIADYEGLIATQAAILDPVIKNFTVGTILDVRPIISSDRKYITIELRPTQAFLVELKTYHINSAWGNDYVLYCPVIRLQKVRTTVALPDNGILLLGGQVQISHWRLSSGIPFLSKLPIIGRLFSSDGETNDKSQLLIFINARIIMFEEIEEKLRTR